MPQSSTRRHLEASKPQPQQYQTPEEFEEALNYWMGHVGRILGMSNPSQDSPPPSESTDKK